MQMFGFDGSAGGMSVAVHVKSAIFFSFRVEVLSGS